MKRKRALAVSAALVAVAAAALAPSRLAAQESFKLDAGMAGHCGLVKDAAARTLCFAARDQYNSRQYRAALLTMRKASSAAPKDGVIRALGAYVMIALGDVGLAERELRQARQDGVEDHVVLSALLPLMMYRHEEEELLAGFPDPAPGARGEAVADILFGRARALLALDRLPEAKAAMDRALALRRNTAALLVSANIAAQQNDKLVAAKLVDEAYRLEPKNGAVALAELKQIQGTGDAAKTLAFSQQMIALFPDAVEFRLVRIETFLGMKQDAKARAEVDALLARSPGSYYGKYYTALLMARGNDKRGAWDVMQVLPTQFVKQNPSFAIPMAQLAVDNGHADSGVAILANAISAAPNSIDTRVQLANLRMAQDSPQAAMSVMEPIKDANDPRVQKVLKQINARIAKDRAF